MNNFQSIKDAQIAIVRSRDCSAVPYLSERYTSLSKFTELVSRFVKSFDCDPAYLGELVAVAPAELETYGVYANKSAVALLNPQVVHNCQNVSVTISGQRSPLIICNSVVTKITVINTVVGVIKAIGGSKISLVEADSLSEITILQALSCSAASSIDKVAYGSRVTSQYAEPGATISFECAPAVNLPDEVSNLHATLVGGSFFNAAWATPAGLVSKAFLRKQGDLNYAPVSSDQNDAYVSGLELNVTYEFLVKTASGEHQSEGVSISIKTQQSQV